MNVLLVGKFPPCQGGIAAKTYWLWRALTRRGNRASVVTWVPAKYRTSSSEVPEAIKLTALEPKTGPWFLPGSDLIGEQLVAAALAAAEVDPPDVVEANYLAPFGLAALATARVLRVPLVLRHAGSDIEKLGSWKPTRRALVALLRAADAVVSPPDRTDPRRVELLEGCNVQRIARYVPDPDAFAYTPPSSSEPRMLFAGKLNYHWRIKAVDTLLDALVSRPAWRLTAIADGIGREAVEAEVARRALTGRVEWHPFVDPSEMPRVIKDVTAVWAVERAGGVPDFSNLVGESAAVGRPCLVSPATATHADVGWLRESPGLFVVDPEDPQQVAGALDQAARRADFGPLPGHEALFRAYVDSNAMMYSALGGGEP